MMNAYSLKLVVSLVAALSLLSSNAALAGPKSLAVGTGHSVALKSDGSVWGWGENFYGQLGNAELYGAQTPVLHPVQAGATTISNVIAMAAPCYTTIVLKADGTVWAYGTNEEDGVLGNNSAPWYKTYDPVQVLDANSTPLNNIVAIAAFGFHAMALKSDGTVWAWGQGSYGQLGDGTDTDRFTAVQVLTAPNTALTGVVAIFAGNLDSFAVKGDGTVWAWGSDINFALGTQTTSYNYVLSYPNMWGNTVEYYSPWAVKVSGLTGMVAVAPGMHHTVALKSDGTVWTWGRNKYGQLGDNSSLTAARSTPAMLSKFTGIKKISTHWHHTLAVKGDGTVWAWGSNDLGQLGNGTTTDRTTPGMVNSLAGVKEIATGTKHSLAITNDDKIFAWGYNKSGQLGDGTQIDRLTPVQVQGITP